MKRVLMVAYHFPPLAGSSGIQRTLRFAQHLPQMDWEPLVLTVHPRAYERTSPDLDAEVAPGWVVRRAFALNTAQHLSWRGRYWGGLARPDKWVTWRFDGVRQGLAMIREFRPDVLWSTYPIATAHLIAARLHQRTGLPWVADFRDPMAQEGYPPDPKTWRSFRRIEESAIRSASRAIFTTPSAAHEYADRYPAHAAKIAVIENGYDEQSFGAAADAAGEMGPLRAGVLTLLHSGIVYPDERDPTCLMEALAKIRRLGEVDTARLRVRFRAALHDEVLRDLARRFGVEDLVEVEPPIPYRQALVEMMRADGLLVLQASNCNSQIPAKVYEYLRARRPLLLLSDPAGDTAQVLRTSGIAQSARLDRSNEITALLSGFVLNPASRAAFVPTEESVRAASREGRTRALAKILDEICGPGPMAVPAA